MKKITTLLISIILLISASGMAFASPQYTAEQIINAAEKLEKDENGNTIYTQKFLDKYGVVEYDEEGNEIIIIPIVINPNIQLDNLVEDIHDDNEMHHEFEIDPIGPAPMHYSYWVHEHDVRNVRTYLHMGSVGLTEWVEEGFTVTKYYNESATLSLSLSLAGGITQSSASAQLGVTIGGSLTVGEGESYSKVVPAGYEGRIAYKYWNYHKYFDDYTTYFDGYITWTEINSCHGMTHPYNSLIILALRVPS